MVEELGGGLSQKSASHGHNQSMFDANYAAAFSPAPLPRHSAFGDRETDLGMDCPLFLPSPCLLPTSARWSLWRCVDGAMMCLGIYPDDDGSGIWPRQIVNSPCGAFRSVWRFASWPSRCSVCVCVSEEKELPREEDMKGMVNLRDERGLEVGQLASRTQQSRFLTSI